MAQTDLHISFDEATFEGQKIKDVNVVPFVGAKIHTRYGVRRVTDVTFDYADDGSCDAHIATEAINVAWGG
jgi:hypothetical protein